MSGTDTDNTEQQTANTDTGQQQTEQPKEQKTYTEDEVQAMISGLKSKNDELKGEKVKVSERLTALEQQKRDQEKSDLESNQQFQSLYELEQANTKEALKKAADANERVAALEREREEGKVKSAASAIGSKLAKTDPGRAEILAEKAEKFAKHTEDGIKYEIGGVEVTEEKVSEHLKAKYPFLIDGLGSNGGGAAGNRGGGAAATQKGADAKANGDLTGFIKAQF